MIRIQVSHKNDLKFFLASADKEIDEAAQIGSPHHMRTGLQRMPRHTGVKAWATRCFSVKTRRVLLGCKGSSLVELALLTPVLVLLLVGAVGLGEACYAAIEVSSAASAGAQYGVQNPTDTAGMQRAALLSGANLNGLQTSASWGCECSDGTSASASCAAVPSCNANEVRYVVVTTSLTYSPPLGFPGVPSTVPLKSTARMRAAR